MGNEAIARAAVEAGICFAAAYPGTPSTEIVETLADMAKHVGIHVEWSTNEKVAFEAAYAAAIAGVKALTAMKHVGVNVAADILMSSAYSGVNAGFIIVSADDPGQHSSQNEQDNRWYGLLSHIPVVEPSSPRDAYHLVKHAYSLSEKYMHPVILRSTTRISHTRQFIEIEQDIPVEKKCKGEFERNVERWVLIPAHGRKQKKRMMSIWKKIQEDDGAPPFITIENPGMKKVVFASGIAYAYVSEALEYMGKKNEYTVVKINLPVPLPYKPIVEVLRDAKSAIIVEELDPVVETQIKKIAHDHGLPVDLHGKDFVPENGELNLEIVYDSLSRFEGGGITKPWRSIGEIKIEPPVPARPPIMCAGCPHRNTFYILKVAANKAGLKNPVFTGDIGCYTLGYQKPFETQMTSFEMGGGVGIAYGLSKVIDEPVIGVVGDSTFYHACIPQSINIVYNKGRAMVVVLDNYYTSMTGHQPHPGTGISATGEEAPRIPAEKILESIGFETIVINPMNVKESIEKVTEAYKKYIEGKPVAIVSRLKCALQTLRDARRKGIKLPVYTIVEDKCTGCMVCVNLLACPAIVVPVGVKKPVILEDICVGCGLCASVCPFNAIVLKDKGSPNWIEAWM
ncbi:MAG: indolepyruvate ferredoxin oxidoreductase subunit alpha [Desulfurococcales archaeon ex4484_58]|nr:MAG: indolepyruvate ferredoxin oxidoreductase subunit alpha [Desulfurococcales archaeon ex4484_58]